MKRYEKNGFMITEFSNGSKIEEEITDYKPDENPLTDMEKLKQDMDYLVLNAKGLI